MNQANASLLISDPFRLKSKRGNMVYGGHVWPDITFYRKKCNIPHITKCYGNNVRLNDQIMLVSLA